MELIPAGPRGSQLHEGRTHILLSSLYNFQSERQQLLFLWQKEILVYVLYCLHKVKTYDLNYWELGYYHKNVPWQYQPINCCVSSFYSVYFFPFAHCASVKFTRVSVSCLLVKRFVLFICFMVNPWRWLTLKQNGERKTAKHQLCRKLILL